MGGLGIKKIVPLARTHLVWCNQQGNFQSPAMTALKLRVVECVRGSGGGAFGRSLVEYALGSLRKLAAQPGTRALARVLETPHPYENNMVRIEPLLGREIFVCPTGNSRRRRIFHIICRCRVDGDQDETVF